MVTADTSEAAHEHPTVSVAGRGGPLLLLRNIGLWPSPETKCGSLRRLRFATSAVPSLLQWPLGGHYVQAVERSCIVLRNHQDSSVFVNTARQDSQLQYPP
jgi:hypothetical protein